MLRRSLCLILLLFLLANPSALATPFAKSQVTSEQKKECVVYITRTGKRYHKTSCGSLRYSKISIARSEALRLGYTPCRRCGGSKCE